MRYTPSKLSHYGKGVHMKTRLLLLASAMLISSSAIALDDDSLIKSRSIPYAKAKEKEARDPFQLPRQARNDKTMVRELNKTAMTKQRSDDMNDIEPAAGE
jgi:hypothetical protein